MRSHFFILIAVAAALPGCGSISEKEARFFRDRNVVIETVRSCFERQYDGLSRWMPSKDVPAHLSFPVEDHIRGYIHSSVGWGGDSSYVVVYRHAPAEGTRTQSPVNAAKVLEHYFGSLEKSGFTSGQHGFAATTITDSMQVASKSWANKDRTILVTGHVVSDKNPGETIITTYVSESLNYQPR